MEYKEQLIKRIASLLLIIALMMPIAVKFIHIFEGHEHVACTEHKTHLHKSNSKCDICIFQIGSFNYDVIGYPELLITETPCNIKGGICAVSLHSFKVNNTKLRAPPIFA
jgi:hypothetical protein